MSIGKKGTLAAVAVVVGCITVNINFPPQEVERAAETIVGEARPMPETGDGGDGGPATPAPGGESPVGEKPSGTMAPPPPPDGGAPAGGGSEGKTEPAPGPSGSTASVDDRPAIFRFLFPAAFAAENDIKINIDTPAIKAIRESLVKRFSKLEPFYKKGAIGENRDGFIEMRDEAGLSLTEKRDVRALIDAENKDRRNLYAEIVRANNFGQDRLKDVQKIFAKEWAGKSRPGWWVQGEDGKWEKKKAPEKKAPEKK
jgi:uncharacterized protein YdbL (DUF1318 family)